MRASNWKSNLFLLSPFPSCIKLIESLFLFDLSLLHTLSALRHFLICQAKHICTHIPCGEEKKKNK